MIQVYEDVEEDEEFEFEQCPDCDGEGEVFSHFEECPRCHQQVWTGRQCKTCDGEGYVHAI